MYNKYEGGFILTIFLFRFDIGEIIAQEQISITPDETLPELRAKLAKIGANLLVETIKKLPSILSNGRPQNETEATYGKHIIYNLNILCMNAN